MNDKPKPPLGLLIAVSLIGPLSMHMIVPSLPDLQKHFATDYSSTQLLVSLFMVAFGASQIVIGPIADAHGRRKVLLIGVLLFCAISVLCTFSTSIEMLIVLRILEGTCACVGMVLGRAIVRDVADDEQTTRMLGYMAVGVSVGPMTAPALGGILFENFGWTATFWFLAILSAIILLFSWLYIPETNRRAGTPFRLSILFRDFRWLLTNREFVLNGSCICFSTAMFYCFVIGAPYVSNHMLGLTPTSYGLWFSLTAIGFALGNFTVGRIGGRFDPSLVVLFGTGAISAFVLVLAGLFALGFGSAAVLFSVTSCMTFANGLMMPHAMAGVLKPDPEKAGSASGLSGFLQFAFAALFSYLMGVAIEGAQTAFPLFAAMFGTSLLSTGAAFLLMRGGTKRK